MTERDPLEGRRHLVRMAGLLLAGVALFVVLRGLAIPKGFGVYGHYRAGALALNQAREPVFAGRAACLDCHSDVADGQKGSRHAAVGCEACHGALARHAAAPDKAAPKKLDEKTLCLSCHAARVGKPAAFKKVDPKEHFEGEACGSCHDKHSPLNGPAGKAPAPAAAPATAAAPTTQGRP